VGVANFFWVNQLVMTRLLQIRYHLFSRMKTVGVVYSRNKLALRTRLRNLNLLSQLSVFHCFPDIHVHSEDFFKFVGGFLAFALIINTYLHAINY